MKRMFRMKPTKYEKTIIQLNDLIRDRESFLRVNAEYDSVFNEDIKALKTAIKVLENADCKRINSQFHFMFGAFLGSLITGFTVVIIRLLAFLII